MRIGFDVDGVLACFYAGYERLVIEKSGVDLFGPHKWPLAWPPVWNWPEHYGYDKALMDYRTGPVWEHIRTAPSFWRDLPTMPEFDSVYGYIQAAGDQHQIYFITDRPGETAKAQTEDWLMAHGIRCPSVIISRKGKGIICDALDLQVYFDDKGENIADVDGKAPQTRGILLERPYNQHVTVKHRAANIIDELPMIEAAA